MESLLSFDFTLSLEEMAMRKVVVNLWSGRDILTSIEMFYKLLSINYDCFETWREPVESKVQDNIAKLVLPASLAKQVLLIVRPIGLQIKEWQEFHENYLKMPGFEEVLEEYAPDYRAEFDASILAKLYWTTAGTLDYLKTAEELIRCEMVDIIKRYMLACLYCLDNYIPVLWEGLSEEIKREFCNEDILRTEMRHLEFLWPYILKGEQSKLDCLIVGPISIQSSFNQRAFAFSACLGQKEAAKYFFQKLTEEENNPSFISRTVEYAVSIYCTASSNYGYWLSNEVHYLLTLLNHEDQMRILKRHPHDFICIFLNWPWQGFCLKIAEIIWSFLPADDYKILLDKMYSCFRRSKYYFPKFIQEFFTRSPIDFRKTFLDLECESGYFFPQFFNTEDSETIKVIFRNVDATDRMRLVSSEEMFYLLNNCIFKGGWHMMETCIREATLSKKDAEILKDAFERNLKRIDRGHIAARSKQWKRFLQLLDEIGASAQNKRCLENETVKKAKKLCSSE